MVGRIGCAIHRAEGADGHPCRERNPVRLSRMDDRRVELDVDFEGGDSRVLPREPLHASLRSRKPATGEPGNEEANETPGEYEERFSHKREYGPPSPH